MSDNHTAIQIEGLVRRFGRTEAVNGLSLSVQAGRCYGLFGRNGAGKTTTIKCLLNHLRPTAGTVRVFGSDPRRDEVGVKARIGYVPEQVAFYPWMTVQGLLAYAASFRPHWNRALEADLIRRFELDPRKKISAMSKGMKAQLALLCAVCPEPDLLLLDEPTSGLDPVVRREFIEAVIGAYQEGAPERRTVFVSTHLIGEFEGLIDEFTILSNGRETLTLESDAARRRFQRVRLRFAAEPPDLQGPGILSVKRNGRVAEVVIDDDSGQILARLRESGAEAVETEGLSLEEIFLAVARATGREEAS